MYPYRTTYDKLEHAHQQITEAGDTVDSRHFLGGRDWVLMCRRGDQPPLAAITVDDLERIITNAIGTALAAADRRRTQTPATSLAGR